MLFDLTHNKIPKSVAIVVFLFLFSSIANAQKIPTTNVITCGWPPNAVKIAGPLNVTSGCTTTSSTPALTCTDAAYDFAAVNGQSYTFSYTSCTAGGSDAGICIFSGTTLNAGICKASALSPGCPNVGNATATLTWVADATASFQVCFFAVSSDCSSKQVETDGSCGNGCFGGFSYKNNSASPCVLTTCVSLASPASGATCRPTNQQLTWNALTDATGYYVYFGTDAAATNIQNGLDVGNVLTWNPGALTPCTKYYWKVVAYNGAGTSTCPETIRNFIVGTVPTAAASATASPASNTICTSSSATLTANGGNPQCGTWQWYEGGCGSGSTIGAGTSLVVSPTVTTTYYVRAEACANSTCKNVTITVNSNPTITGNPSDQTVCTGVNANFTVATSAGSPSYQWQMSSDNITWFNVVNGTPAGVTYTNATSAILTVNGSSAVALYYYRCVVSVAGGCSTNSNSAALTINAYPTVNAIGGGAASVMVGNNTPAFTNSTGGGTWSITNGTGSATINGSGVATGVSIGTVTVNYSVTQNGCTTTVTAPLNVITFMPVELINFGVKCDGAKAILRWTTATESNNDYFLVERAEGNNSVMGEWNSAGTVKGTGNSTTSRSYEFADEQISNFKTDISDLYYRLKQIDFDGKSKYFGPVSLELCSSRDFTLITQTVFVDELSATLIAKENTEVMIQVIDLQGRFIRSEKINAMKGANQLQLDLRNIEAGTYFIKIYNEKNFVTRRVVKI